VNWWFVLEFHKAVRQRGREGVLECFREPRLGVELVIHHNVNTNCKAHLVDDKEVIGRAKRLFNGWVVLGLEFLARFPKLNQNYTMLVLPRSLQITIRRFGVYCVRLQDKVE
jgi:hypothetical protein